MDVTRLLTRWAGGDQNALGELIPVVYAELRSWPIARCAANVPITPFRPLPSFTKRSSG